MLQSSADFSMLSTILEAIDNDLDSDVANILRSKIKDIAMELSNAAASIEDEATAIAAYRIAAHLVKECDGEDRDDNMTEIMTSMVWRVDRLSEYADEILTDYGMSDHMWDVIHSDIDETVNWAADVREMFSSDDE